MFKTYTNGFLGSGPFWFAKQVGAARAKFPLTSVRNGFVFFPEADRSAANIEKSSEFRVFGEAQSGFCVALGDVHSRSLVNWTLLSSAMDVELVTV